MNNNSILELTNDAIPDGNLRELIFGVTELEKEDIVDNYIGNMNDILIVAFFAFFFQWQEKRNEEHYSNNSKRINDLFRTIYGKNKLSLEIIAFLLTEIQLDVSTNKNSIYSKMIQGNVEESKIPIISELIRTWRKSYKYSLLSFSILRDMYVSLLKDLIVLKNLQIIKTEKDFMYQLSIKGEVHKYDAQIYFITTEDDDYYLYNIELDNDNVLLHYISFDGRKTYPQDDSIYESLDSFYRKTGINITNVGKFD